MEPSILKSTKKILSVDPEYTVFDLDIMTHINTAFFSLHEIGLGPAEGFMIEDDIPVWTDFIVSGPNLNAVKTYVYLKVRVLFDSPSAWHLVAALEKQLTELEWRLGVDREGTDWVDPNPPRPPLSIYDEGLGEWTSGGYQVIVL